MISDDPTPLDPITLRLAALDPSPNVVYLARPCQYSTDPACTYTYWSGRRFSEPVINSMNEAVSDYVRRAGSKEIHLVGYSGGGAVAVLLADRRTDVASIRTVAGDLDPQGLNRYHGVTPLTDSLDPMEAAFRVSRLPQRHFIGSRDKRVPYFVVENFILASESKNCIQVTKVPGLEHAVGWDGVWPELVNLPVECKDEN